jgi:hypothetical protein
MKTVYKYEIYPDEPEISIHKDAKVLTAAFQGNTFCLWAEVDTENEYENRNIHMFGTGHKIPCEMGVDYQYIATGFMDNGLVFHAYERLGL